MPIEREPATKVAKSYVPPNTKPYKVKDGDSFVSIAAANGIPAWDLIELNFKTRNADEVNWYLHFYVGCKVEAPDRKNWKFSSRDTPGIIRIPVSAPVYYVVPDMQLVAQDRTMSCWYASAQMLITWRQRKTQSSEIRHPDPATVDKWNLKCAGNKGIQNSDIPSFASDMGFEMVGAVTPSPELIQDLMRRHGPLWVNGKTHITVIAGIRKTATAVDVLVFDPAIAALRSGAWIDFFTAYGLTAHTSLDAGAGAETSMLYIED